MRVYAIAKQEIVNVSMVIQGVLVKEVSDFRKYDVDTWMQFDT